MQSLVGFNFAQEAREADFRYGLVRVRENAESVAFYRGETDEKSLLAMVSVQRNFAFFGVLKMPPFSCTGQVAWLFLVWVGARMKMHGMCLGIVRVAHTCALMHAYARTHARTTSPP